MTWSRHSRRSVPITRVDDSVRTRRSNGCRDGIDTDSSGALPEVAAVHRIAIADQKAWLIVPRRRLDDLAPYPGGGRVGAHVDVHQLAPAMGDNYQDVQRLEGERGHREQVGRACGGGPGN